MGTNCQLEDIEDDEDLLCEEILRLNGKGYNDSNIAEIIGSTFRIVSYRRRKMNLPKNSPYTKMSTEKKKTTMRQTLERQTGSMMNYRTKAHELNAVRLGWGGYKLGEALVLYALERHRPLTHVELLRRINMKKSIEDWKPMTTENMLPHYVGNLIKQGLVKRMYPTGQEWRTGKRTYTLSEEVEKQVKTRNHDRNCFRYPESR